MTISCCDDYEYDSKKDYTGGVIYCYYAPKDSDSPGFHIHWMSAGGASAGVSPLKDSQNWIRLCRPGKCADCDDITIPG